MVSARHLIGAGIVFGVAVGVGCVSRPHAKARPGVAPGSAEARGPVAGGGGGGGGAVKPDSPEATGDAADVTARSLAQHTESYAKSVESLLSKRPAASADGASPAGPSRATQFPGLGDGTGPETDSSTFSTLPSGPAAHGKRAEAQANTGMQVSGAGAREEPEVEDGGRQLLAGTQLPEASDAAEKPPLPKPQADAARPAGAMAVAKPPAVSANDLLQKLAAKLKADPRDTVSHLDYQLLQFLLDEQVPDLSTIAPLPAEDRELLTTLLDGLANFRNGLRADANSLQSRKIAPLLELAERLRSQGELTLTTAALCTSVQRFGVYEPMDPPRFVSGKKDNEAVLYCEVANFSSQLNSKKLWETKLKQEAVLYSESGLSVWSDRSDTMVDQSRNRLHDFFIADKVRLPGNLPVGRYLMKMTVTDLHANRVAEATVPIQIVAQ